MYVLGQCFIFICCFFFFIIFVFNFILKRVEREGKKRVCVSCVWLRFYNANNIRKEELKRERERKRFSKNQRMYKLYLNTNLYTQTHTLVIY